MKFNELDSVKTQKNFPEDGIKMGDIGKIVMAFSTPNEAYEVEFVNNDGSTKAMLALGPEDLYLYVPI